MASTSVPRDHGDFQIAILCALALEAECVIHTLDSIWKDKRFEALPQDDNSYTLGALGDHNVVIVHMPGMGSTRAATAVANLSFSYPNIKLALVVGICGGMPTGVNDEEIFLGDVVISKAIIEYDFGKQYPDGFKRTSDVLDTLGPPSEKILGLLAKLEVGQNREDLRVRTIALLRAIQKKSPNVKHPGSEQDILYHSSYTHAHRAPSRCFTCQTTDEICDAATKAKCEDLGCEEFMREPRRRLLDASNSDPMIHIGKMGCASTVMKSGYHRDNLARMEEVIAVEMEGAGVWRQGQSIVIKGVCDYADSHKRKNWQWYAAATAAACTKAFLLEWWASEKREITPDRRWLLHINFPVLIVTDDVSDESVQRFHTFPFRPNQDFVARPDLSGKLSDLMPVEEKCSSAALWGLGGSGKTQIALEFAYRRYETTYCSVFWVFADSYENFLLSYLKIARLAGLSSQLQDTDLLQAVCSWLEHQCKWLLVLDSADDLRLFTPVSPQGTSSDRGNLSQFIPKGPQGVLLWTTRDESLVGQLVGVQRGINVVGMSDPEARKLLTQTSLREIGLVEENQAVAILLRHLERLPLAIMQAACYIRAIRLTYVRYLLRYRQQTKRWQLLATTSAASNLYQPDGKPNSVLTTWSITTQYLQEICPEANWTLQVAAWFHHQNIPLSLFQSIGRIWREYCRLQHRSQQTTSSASIASVTQASCHSLNERHHSRRTIGDGDTDEVEADDSLRHEDEKEEADDDDDNSRLALTRLIEHSFLRSQPQTNGEESFHMHELVQEATRYVILHKPSDQKTPCTTESALAVILQSYPSGSVETWQRCEQLLVHALSVTHLSELEVFTVEFCEILVRISGYLYGLGRLKESEEICARILQLRKRKLGENHPDTIQSMADLATRYIKRNRLTEALQLSMDVLAKRKEVLGKDHLDTIDTMANIGHIRLAQGQLEDAEKIQLLVGSLRVQLLGNFHPVTIQSVSDVATIYHAQGRFSEAEQLKVRVLALRKEIFGERHPHTIRTMASLGVTYSKQGRFSDAEDLLLTAIELRKDLLGIEHPDTIRTVADLGMIMHMQGRTEEGTELLNNLIQQVRQLGPLRSDVEAPLNYLI